MSEENEVIMAIFRGIYEQRQKQHTHIGQVQWIISWLNYPDVISQEKFIRFALWNSNCKKFVFYRMGKFLSLQMKWMISGWFQKK